MKKAFIPLSISICIILFLSVEIFQRDKEYNILLTHNSSLGNTLKRIVLSKEKLKEALYEKLKDINKLAQNLQTAKKLLQVKLEEEIIKRKKAEKNLRLTTNKMDFFEQQIAGLNEEIKLYKDELISIYKASGEGGSYGLTLSKKIELAKEDQIPYGRVAARSKKYNFIIVTPFNEKNNLALGTAIEIYDGNERIALGSIKSIKNNLALIDDIISYSKERDIKQGDLVLVQK